MLGPIDSIFLIGLVVATVLSLFLRGFAGPRNGGPLLIMMGMWPAWLATGVSLDLLDAPASFYIFPAATMARGFHAYVVRRKAPAAWNRLLLGLIYIESALHPLFWAWHVLGVSWITADAAYWSYQFALNVCTAIALCIVASSGGRYAALRAVDLLLPDPSSLRHAWPRHPGQGKRYTYRPPWRRRRGTTTGAVD